MTEADYTSLRLEKVDRDRLVAYRDRLAKAVAANPSRFPSFLHDRPLGLGSVIRYLLFQRDGHRARSAAAKLAKRQYVG